ncbi:hypothetical protein L9F63_004747, partial [Diploptera punctata]
MGRTCTRFRTELQVPHQYVLVNCYMFSPGDSLTDMFDDTIAFFHEEFNSRKTSRGMNVLLLRIINFPTENSFQTNDILRRLSAVEMRGFSKMAQTDLGNMLPLLSGLSESSFKNACSLNQSESCPFLWRSLAPEQVSMLLINAPTDLNFSHPPTDLYPETFMKVSSVRYCSSNKKALQYLNKLFTCVHATIFATTWLSEATDEELAEFLTRNHHIFSKTAVILYLGDFLHILIPNYFKLEHPAKWINLRYNSLSLTTPLDVHETIRDVLLLPNNPRQPRGMSLFSYITRYRKCNQVGVPHAYCKCKKFLILSTSQPAVQFLAISIVHKICPGTPAIRVKQAMVTGNLYYLVVITPGDIFEGTVQLNYENYVVHYVRCKSCVCRL